MAVTLKPVRTQTALEMTPLEALESLQKHAHLTREQADAFCAEIREQRRLEALMIHLDANFLIHFVVPDSRAATASRQWPASGESFAVSLIEDLRREIDGREVARRVVVT